MTWYIGTSCYQQDITRKEYLGAVFQAVLLDVLLAYLFYNHWLAGIVLLPVSLLYMRQWRSDCCRKKELKFREQFRDSMYAFSASMKAGYSVENAIRAAEKDLRTMYGSDSRIRREFTCMIHELDMNRTAETVLKGFSERVKQEDVENFVTVFVVAKRAGGDSISIIRNAVRMIGDKMEVEREIQTLLAAKILEFRVMCIIPLGMVLYMRLTFPEFLSVLYGNPVGVVLMTVCLGIYGYAWKLGQKIIRIEV